MGNKQEIETTTTSAKGKTEGDSGGDGSGVIITRKKSDGSVGRLLERIENLKLSAAADNDNDNNNNKNEEKTEENNKEKENNDEENEKEKENNGEKKFGAVENIAATEENHKKHKADDDDLIAKTTTTPPENDEKYTASKAAPSNGGGGVGQQQGRLSPAEFFQTSRLRSSGLANKSNTAQTYGGSSDLVHHHQQHGDMVDDIAKGIEKVHLGKEQEEAGAEEQEENNKQSDLLDRSPVSVYPAANRHAHHPYQPPKAGYHPGNYRASIPRASVNEYASCSPASYIEQQRYRATCQRPGPKAQQQQPPPAQVVPCSYQSPPPPSAQNHYHYQHQYYGSTATPSPPGAQIWSPPPQPAAGGGGYHYYQTTPPPAAQAQQQYHHQQQHQEQDWTTPPSSVYPTYQYPNVENVSPVPPPNEISPPEFVDYSPSRPTEEAKLINNSVVGGKEAEAGGGSEKSGSSSTNKKDQEERPANAAEINIEALPDELCDFILSYSRYYTNEKARSTNNATTTTTTTVAKKPTDDDAEKNERETETGEETENYDDSAPIESVLSIPDVVGLDFDQDLWPMIDFTDLAELFQSAEEESAMTAAAAATTTTDPKSGSTATISARQRLRERIPESDLESAWAWAMRCCQSRPEALFFRDKDGDSLLHIVVWHKDLAKIYVLTEIMCKSGSSSSDNAGRKLFGLPNKLNETPLFLAVEKGLLDVVAYLLEYGADPNVRPHHPDADLPLHYAAARGMTEMVEIIVRFAAQAGINDVLNASGLTPLLCAVRNHGSVDEESQCAVDNTSVVKALLKAGADATISDRSNGRNVVHYCVERMDPGLLQLFGDYVDRMLMYRLVNGRDYEGYTPLDLLSIGGGGGGGAIGNDGMTITQREDEAASKQKLSKLLVEYGVVSNLSPVDHRQNHNNDQFSFNDDVNSVIPTDSLQTFMLDTLISSPEAY